MPPYPPAIIVHGLDHAHAALAGGGPVTLLSAPGAGVYAGCGWWRAVMRAARQAHPGLDFPDILDCGDAPGRALAALRAGQALLVLTCAPVIWADIAGRAVRQGATLLAVPPPALDLAKPGATQQLRAWIAQE